MVLKTVKLVIKLATNVVDQKIVIVLIVPMVTSFSLPSANVPVVVSL